MNSQRVAILGGNRTPFARVNSAFHELEADALLTQALAGLVARFGLAGARPGLVAGGAVLKSQRHFNLVREAVLGTALDPATPCMDLQQACATSLQAALTIADRIALGRIDWGIACGVDSASNPPLELSDGLRAVLLRFARARGLVDRLRVLAALRPSHLLAAPPSGREPRTGLRMGEHAELSARAWGISRESQDDLALHSHLALAAAWERGFFAELVTPLAGLARDNILRPDTSLARLAGLGPAFASDPRATITAGNASALTDGAAAVLLGSESWARTRGLTPLAWLRDHETAAVDFFTGAEVNQREGLLLAPVYAVPRLLLRAGLSLQDFDLYEIHEAFAAQVLCTLKAWSDRDFCRTRLGLPDALGEIDRSRLNLAGSSLATGHPFAATGARILATAARLLAERDSGRCLVSVCAAGGQGVCAILER